MSEEGPEEKPEEKLEGSPIWEPSKEGWRRVWIVLSVLWFLVVGILSAVIIEHNITHIYLIQKRAVTAGDWLENISIGLGWTIAGPILIYGAGKAIYWTYRLFHWLSAGFKEK